MAFGNDWIPVKAKHGELEDGILVYKKEIEGSPVLSFKGEGMVDASLARVATVIFDTTRAPEWVDNLEESKLLRWATPTSFIEYDHVGTPFIMKDREFVSLVEMNFDKKAHTLKFHYQSTDDPAVPKTDYIRGTLSNTSFLLKSVENDQKTYITGEIHCDPMGSVPKWLVNAYQSAWPRITLRNLRRQVKKPDIREDPRFIFSK